MNSNRPFSLGSTASAGISIAGPMGLQSQLPTTAGHPGEANAFRADLAGYVWEDRDEPMGNTTVAAQLGTVAGKFLTAGTRRPMKLRAVQAGENITTTCIGQVLSFSSSAGEYGVVVTATSTDGGVGKPIHGSYPVGTVFSTYDWLIVVEEGPAIVVPADGVTLAANGPIAIESTTGHVTNAAAGDVVLGTCDVSVVGDIDTTTHAHLAMIYVNDGIQAQDAA